MIDYIEGWINLNRMTKDLHEALLKKDVATAKELCTQIITETRLINQQIKLQFPDNN